MSGPVFWVKRGVFVRSGTVRSGIIRYRMQVWFILHVASSVATVMKISDKFMTVSETADFIHAANYTTVVTAEQISNNITTMRKSDTIGFVHAYGR